MDPLRLAVHTSLGSPAKPSAAAFEAAELWARDELAELGHRDFAYSARELAAMYADTERNRWALVLAYDGDRCVGLASVQLPEWDNRHMLSIDLRIDPASDAGEVLDGLWSVVADLMATESTRDTVIVWVPSARVAEGSTPRSGAGHVRRTPVTDWLLAHGFILEQVEIASTLEVAEGLVGAEALEGESADPGYDVISWVGVTPPELRDAMAVQRARMSTDVPSGEIAIEPEIWDAARVRDEDQVILAMGRSMIWSVAVEQATGAVVAHTLILAVDEGLPEVAFQEDTLVQAAHRGHGLGLRVKVANLRRLASERPGVRRIHTWNADENSWMLAINRQLGFRATSTMGCWQLRRG